MKKPFGYIYICQESAGVNYIYGWFHKNVSKFKYHLGTLKLWYNKVLHQTSDSDVWFWRIKTILKL